MARPQFQLLPTCAHCGRSIGTTEQRYDLEGQILCAPCATAYSAEPEEPAEPEAYSAEDMVNFSVASTPASRRRSIHRTAKKTAPLGPLISAGLGILLVSIIGIWLYSSGTLGRLVTQTKSNLSGVGEENAQIARYNALITSANVLARDKKYADAAAKLREAKGLLDQDRKLLRALPPNELATLNESIGKYENYAQGKFPSATPAPGADDSSKPAPSVPQPANVDFMKTNDAPHSVPQAPPADDGTIPLPGEAVNEPPAPAGLPTIIEVPVAPRPAEPKR